MRDKILNGNFFFSCIHNGWVCIGESYDQFFKDAVWNIAYISMHTNSMMPSYQFGVSNSIKYRQLSTQGTQHTHTQGASYTKQTEI